ncbi:MAG: hypothetical protein EA397_02720 [Deltaproteobacteria bacterium]|nr:MAG: hypothetical protein EA397_02720 [Deltaproteobacteria bacterium]
MRRRILLLPFVGLILLPSTLACFGRFSDERELCETYMDCLAEEDPAQIPAATAAYGDASPCWESRSDAERCAAACEAGISAMRGCELPSSGEGGPLSEEAFNVRFTDRFCAQLEHCSEGELFCEHGDGPTDDGEDCDYNPAAAEACLDGAWGCTEPSDSFPSFPDLPEICGQVYRCTGDSD